MDFDGLTDQEIADLIEEMERLLARRQSIEAVRVQMGDAIKTARESGVLTAPEWGAGYVAPVDATELCVEGDVRELDGAVWRLDRGSCVGPPSVENGWTRVEGS